MKKRKVAETSFTDVDVLALDQECAKQASLYLKWAEALAEAKADLNDADSELDVVKAELGFAIRNKPQRFGISRLSNDVVEEARILQPEYQDAKRALNDAKRRVEMIQAAVKALEHKKQSLENLTYLQGQGYFAEPKTPRGPVGDRVVEARKRSVRHSIERGGKHEHRD